MVLGYLAIALGLWWPRIAALLLPAVAITATLACVYPPFIFAAPSVIIALAFTRRYKEAGATALLVIATALYVTFGPQHNDMLVWLLIPLTLASGGLGATIGEAWAGHRQSVAILSATQDLADALAHQERNDMATELHDKIGHALALATMIAENATLAAEASSAAAFHQIGSACREGSSNLAGVVSLLRRKGTLEPPQRQPPSRLAQHVASLLEECGWTVNLRWDQRIDQLPGALTTLVARFLTETTTNILKHGQPRTTVSITANLTSSMLQITITNDVKKERSAQGVKSGLNTLQMAAEAIDTNVTAARNGNTWTAHLEGDMETIFGQGFNTTLATHSHLSE